MNHFVALLRGINVGGNNIIKMSALTDCCRELGLLNVRTYIQSGNIIFSAKEDNEGKLVEMLERALSKTFKFEATVVVYSEDDLRSIVHNAPVGFGTDLDTFRYDVVFLKEPVTPSEAMQFISIKPGVDEVFPGKRVLYFSRLISKATQSHLPRLVSLPVYKSMTIRNWNTTTKLLGLLEAIEN